MPIDSNPGFCREGMCLFLVIYDSNDALMLPALPFFLHLTYLRRNS